MKLKRRKTRQIKCAINNELNIAGFKRVISGAQLIALFITNVLYQIVIKYFQRELVHGATIHGNHGANAVHLLAGILPATIGRLANRFAYFRGVGTFRTLG